MISIGQIADAAGWPSDQLVVLDRRPVGLLFVDESGEQIVVRHARTHELRELDSIPVTVTTAGRAGSGPTMPDDHARVERQLSAREILAVADDPTTIRIELSGEPIIND